MDERQKPGAIILFVRRHSSSVFFYGYIELPNPLETYNFTSLIYQSQTVESMGSRGYSGSLWAGGALLVVDHYYPQSDNPNTCQHPRGDFF